MLSCFADFQQGKYGTELATIQWVWKGSQLLGVEKGGKNPSCYRYCYHMLYTIIVNHPTKRNDVRTIAAKDRKASCNEFAFRPRCVPVRRRRCEATKIPPASLTSSTTWTMVESFERSLDLWYLGSKGPRIFLGFADLHHVVLSSEWSIEMKGSAAVVSYCIRKCSINFLEVVAFDVMRASISCLCVFASKDGVPEREYIWSLAFGSRRAAFASLTLLRFSLVSKLALMVAQCCIKLRLCVLSHLCVTMSLPWVPQPPQALPGPLCSGLRLRSAHCDRWELRRAPESGWDGSVNDRNDRRRATVRTKRWRDDQLTKS